MAIVTISRGSYSNGKAIAEGVARELGYDLISREILIEASAEFNIPEVKLVRAIHDAPSILERFTHGKEKYIAYIQTALLKHLQKDNCVYHGLAGHFFLQGISHVLKVRVIADLEERVKLEMKRENITREEALRILKNDDRQRRLWSKHLYGIDTWDPSLYGLVIHIRKLKVEDAVQIICNTVQREQFRTTAESKQALQDLLLASEVKAALAEYRRSINISAHKGLVVIRTHARGSKTEKITENARNLRHEMPGIEDIEVQALSAKRITGFS
jgi:cytidylate kinase